METPTPAYSITIKVSRGNRPGTLGRFASAVGAASGNIEINPLCSVEDAHDLVMA
ncbi:MAG: hypothetical protein OXE79_05585 [Acidimicrobiaceae bacterium]|nr:hypothetical protein [Acidimicrobiaceae bacterium]MCY4176214.1 hypothetical protein [Acidimicrobiaceae bacterium]MCY4280195.1 hypothetical protein [Acidimicrobiaceae bacterium]MCY4293623.1 hypothetical protein [Acidimicrobiaceae bacterium]